MCLKLHGDQPSQKLITGQFKTNKLYQIFTGGKLNLKFIGDHLYLKPAVIAASQTLA